MKHVGTLLEGAKKGPGHQFMDIFTSVVMSHWFGWKYAHCPFRGATTKEDNSTVSRWEYFWRLGLGHYSLVERLGNCQWVYHVWPGSCSYVGRDSRFQHRDSKVTEDMRLEQIVGLTSQCADDVLIVFRRSARLCTFIKLHEWEQAGIAPAGIYARVRNWWHRKYWSAHKNRGPCGEEMTSYLPSNGGPTVAALMRLAGSANALQRHEQAHRQRGSDIKWLLPEYFIGVLNRLRRVLPDSPIMLFSDGPEGPAIAQIRDAGFDVHVCDNNFPDLFRIYHTLVTADVLVCGNSGFSAVPGYLGYNVVVKPEQPILAMPDDVVADRKTGEFDTAQLLERISRKAVT